MHNRITQRTPHQGNVLHEYLKEAESNLRLMMQLLDSSDCAESAHEQLQCMSQRVQQALTSLGSMSVRITALIDLGIELAAERDPEELLQMACRVAHHLCGSRHAAIGIVDDERTALRHYILLGSDGTGTANPPLPNGDGGILAELLRQREPIRLSESGEPVLPGLPEHTGGTRSFLGVAIASPSQVYGWLVLVERMGAPAFSEVDERIATTVSSQLAVAWENLVLYKEIAQHHDQLEREFAERRVLDESLRQFRLAMDTTDDAIMLVDPVSVSFVDFNATTCKMFGYTAEELHALGPMALGAGTRDELRNLYSRLIQGDSEPANAEIRLQRKDGSQVLVEVHRRPVRSGNGWIMVAVARDLTEREAERERMRQMAHYDALTGLPNRMLFTQSLKRALAQVTAPSDAVVVLLLDLDRFQKTNDTLGHAGGDELLRQVADRLLQSLLKRDTVGRLGADVFGIILPIPGRKQEELVVLDRIRAALSPRFSIEGSHITVTASIGIAVFPDDADNAETLLKYADTAMHWAKEAGRNAWRYFTAEMNRHALERLALENALRTAIEQQQFVLLFQPKANITTGLVSGAEVLLRWQRPGLGEVSPAVFIALLEETGLVVQVGAWVIEETCRLLGKWQQAGHTPVQLSFNVSARQFFDARLEKVIVNAVQRHGVNSSQLMLELTESSLMADVEQAALVLKNLKRLGLHVALDDFGTGYSSLAYLRRFPIDTLKIDIAFIRELATNSEDAAIVSAIISMAHSLKLNVVAEGVEEVRQLQFLRDHHCDEMQGYWYSRPLPELEFRALVDGQVALKYA